MPNSCSHSLKAFNTLGLDQHCRDWLVAETTEQLIHECSQAVDNDLPLLILGGGSNLVLCEDFDGLVVKVSTQGITVTEDIKHFYLSVAAGEDWHALVEYTLEHRIYGLENLALIPGTTGAAPMQNIGAYGVEFCDVCDWVEYFDLETKQFIKLTASECRFEYRDSIFKQSLKNKAVITQVGIKLAKDWQPQLSYGPLQQLVNTINAHTIFDTVCEVRRSKLPDPSVIGNAGSFFKNPIISNETYQHLLLEHPDVVAYPHGNQIKLAAGWLIDKVGLKGHCLGQAGVHDKQALVLINRGHATGKDITTLANYIIMTIKAQFNVSLEIEPRLIGRTGEISIHG
ncbi:MAG: UDP-N-acetylmuramate dehydrogenase [Shewanella sp.]|nr:UDP-N-acetylmuramate dehydrogenase [Shewanella sp.]